MEIPISQSEKLDIFLALATFYEFKIIEDDKNDSDSTQLELAFQSLSALGEGELKQLKERAKRFESLSQEKQNNWQKFWLEKLRLRGQTQRLDESIHTDNIVYVLRDEPIFIQQMIYNNLPDKLAKDVENILPQINTSKDNPISQTPNEKTSSIVREKFLSNFVAFENIYQPNLIDELSFEQLETFIWELGIRETAISCRGIKTKESLAVFLKPFDEENTKEIATNIRKLEDLKPKRVMLAEILVKEVFQTDADTSKWITNVGLQMLAITYAFRDNISKRFIEQKFPLDQSEKLTWFINNTESNKMENLQEISEEIIDLANEYKEVGN